MFNRARTLGTRGALLAALSLAVLSLDARPAEAQSGPPMVWRHDISRRVEQNRVQRYGVGPYADGQTRLETELRAEIALNKLPEAKRLMNGLVKNQGEAEKIFGKNHRVTSMSKRPRKVWDLYIDTRDGRLAKNNAALRIRIENGIAQVNYKPPQGQFFPEGLKVGMEAGITLAADQKTGKLPARTVDFFKNTRLVDNPLRELRKQFPDLQVEDFMFLQLEVKQDRQMYEVQELEHGQWVKKSEISVDAVTARDPKSKRTQVKFGRVELEGDHVSAGQLNARQQAALSAANWRGPHKANDVFNPAFAESKDVKQIRGYTAALQKFLGVKAIKESKYVSSRNLLAAKGVRFERGRFMVSGVKRPPLKRTASSNAARTRTTTTRAKANPRARAR